MLVSLTRRSSFAAARVRYTVDASIYGYDARTFSSIWEAVTWPSLSRKAVRMRSRCGVTFCPAERRREAISGWLLIQTHLHCNCDGTQSAHAPSSFELPGLCLSKAGG